MYMKYEAITVSNKELRMPYFVIENDFIDECYLSNMDGNELKIYLVLWRRSNSGKHYCFCSRRNLAKKTGIKESLIPKIIISLEQKGFLEVDRTQTGAEYKVFGYPLVIDTTITQQGANKQQEVIDPYQALLEYCHSNKGLLSFRHQLEGGSLIKELEFILGGLPRPDQEKEFISTLLKSMKQGNTDNMDDDLISFSTVEKSKIKNMYAVACALLMESSEIHQRSQDLYIAGYDTWCMQ